MGNVGGIWGVWDAMVVHYTSAVWEEYGEVQTLQRGEHLTPLAFPELVLNVDEVLV